MGKRKKFLSNIALTAVMCSFMAGPSTSYGILDDIPSNSLTSKATKYGKGRNKKNRDWWNRR